MTTNKAKNYIKLDTRHQQEKWNTDEIFRQGKNTYSGW